MKGGPVKIKVRRGAIPKQAYTARQIPINLEAAYKREIEEQLRMGVLERAEDEADPSEWLHPLVVTRKKDPKEARVTVDLRELNFYTVRPVCPSTAPRQVVCRVDPEAKFFSVFDGLKGFHQVELDKASRRLTTFVAPIFGRLRYRRMPMGWSGSSDVFSARMDEAFGGMPGVHRVVEDILVAGPGRSTWRWLSKCCRHAQTTTSP
jgi:hypothetical protein